MTAVFGPRKIWQQRKSEAIAEMPIHASGRVPHRLFVPHILIQANGRQAVRKIPTHPNRVRESCSPKTARLIG